MAVTVASFRAAFPEFATADNPSDALIQLKIDSAKLQINSTIWGSRYDEGVLWLTAMLLASSPFGEPSRLSIDRSHFATIYHEHFTRLRNTVAFGLR